MLLSRELALVSATAKFGQSHNFFEMIRVDFVVDEDLNVFIMEVILGSLCSQNMSYISLSNFDFTGEHVTELVVSAFSTESAVVRTSHL